MDGRSCWRQLEGEAVSDSWREDRKGGGSGGGGEGGGHTVDSKERAPTCQMYLPNCKVTRQSEKQRKRGRERERCGERMRDREIMRENERERERERENEREIGGDDRDRWLKPLPARLLHPSPHPRVMLMILCATLHF